jgi:hypothetical protein
MTRAVAKVLGEIKGTPTILLIKPKKKNDKEKMVVNYKFERKAKDMKQFIDDGMPNYTERITHGADDFQKTKAKAAKYGLPRALFFTSKPRTSPLTKYLSTEFRRRLLLVEIPPTKNNQQLMKEYGVDPDNLPALIIVPPPSTSTSTGVDDDESASSANNENIRYDGDYARLRLDSFLSKHALKEKVFSPIIEAKTDDEPSKDNNNKPEEASEESAGGDKQKVHTEF